MLEDLSVLYSMKNKDSLLDKYSSESVFNNYQNEYTEAGIPLYKEDDSNLSKLHTALSENNLNHDHVNFSFNARGRNLGHIGVIERMRGLVANREDMNLGSISLAETYMDKALDTRTMQGVYNFTISDIYKDRNKWLATQGALSYGGMITGENNLIESDLYNSSSIYTQNKEENNNYYEKQEHTIGHEKKEMSMSELIDNKYNKNQQNTSSIVNIQNKNNQNPYNISNPIYSGGIDTNYKIEPYNYSKKEEKKEIKKTISMKDIPNKYKIQKDQDNHINIDTLNYTKEQNKKTFKKKEKNKKDKKNSNKFNEFLKKENVVEKKYEKIKDEKKEVKKKIDEKKDIENKKKIFNIDNIIILEKKEEILKELPDKKEVLEKEKFVEKKEEKKFNPNEIDTILFIEKNTVTSKKEEKLVYTNPVTKEKINSKLEKLRNML